MKKWRKGRMVDEVANVPSGTKVIIIENVKAYDPWISIKKFLGQAAIVGGVSTATWVVQYGLPQLSLELPEYVGVITVISGIITFLLNYNKHKDDTKEVSKEATVK